MLHLPTYHGSAKRFCPVHAERSSRFSVIQYRSKAVEANVPLIRLCNLEVSRGCQVLTTPTYCRAWLVNRRIVNALAES